MLERWLTPAQKEVEQEVIKLKPDVDKYKKILQNSLNELEDTADQQFSF